jgi:hypothetical protein
MEGEPRLEPDGSPAPGRVERLLRRWVGSEPGEALWGDLIEEAAEVERRRGRMAAQLWKLRQLASLAIILVVRARAGHWPMAWEVRMDRWTARRRRAAAIVGVVAASPAAALVLGGLLFSFSGSVEVVRALEATLFDVEGAFYRVVLHPVVVLGGLVVALGLNLIPLLGVEVDRAAGVARATVALRLRRTHLAIAAAGLALLALLLAYTFTENFEIHRRTLGPDAAAVAAAPPSRLSFIR